MIDDATTSDVGRAERTVLDGFAGLLLAFPDHDVDNVDIFGGSENGLQLLLGRFTQDALVTLVREVHVECYEKRSRN